MSEEQVHSITVCRQDLSHFDTGGGCREVYALIYVDDSLPAIRQREALIHEVLGVYMGIMVSTEDIAEMAEGINDALQQWENGGHNGRRKR